MRKLRDNWLRITTHIGALLPLALLVWDYWRGLFIVDPIREITTRTGKTALILLVLSLACTSINMLFGFKRALRVHRALGLYAFLYASLHVLTFIGWDYGFDIAWLGPAIFSQRFVLPGLVAFLLLIPLVITSTRNWQRRLGKNWRRLHRLVYLVIPLVIVHFIWLVKDPREPLWYGAVVFLLLILRVPHVRKAVSKFRHLFSRAV
ncbi:MAG: protein-methionine-sulfoxide reductase heme-binding subunit MsrQ [Chloroflexota bacterium]|nr:protein-methionine-sulfoxide reductase heme-binding subunit MsrQ [Chloroflexota bacterium]